MIINPPSNRREPRKERIDCDLAVVGGGLAGVCCAVTAARAGLQVTLIQDRPILGGNASSEVRLWVLGATSHMGNNNRWAREGGVIDEILVENMFRNREGNPVLLDTVILEIVANEPNIRLLFNTAVFDLDKENGSDSIQRIRGFCSQNSTLYEVEAPLFCDASGDGIIGFLSGAAFRMGAESRDEFGEKFAPDKEYGELLGHSIYFYTRDTGKPVRFVAPKFALDDIERIPRYHQFNTKEHGCQLWWIEYGGRLDTVHATEEIKWELWRVVYGVWNHIKNSGEFPEAETLTLDWVGLIPGKRESRRFEGDTILIQQDVVEQHNHEDAVSYGGWSLDLHPADGVFSERPGCDQWHSKGVYQIPYRCYYSRNIRNLFLAGRIISASHVAFGSTRVMATCAHGGQAVGMAAVLCRRHDLLPANLSSGPRLLELQRELLKVGQHIPGHHLDDSEDLVRSAAMEASSEWALGELDFEGPTLPVTDSLAMLVPLQPGPAPKFEIELRADQPTQIEWQLRLSSRPQSHTPDLTVATGRLDLNAGDPVRVVIEPEAVIDQARYGFVCLLANPQVSVRCSRMRVTGVLALTHRFNQAVAHGNVQEPPKDIGIDRFEFWRPQRRPEGHNIAVKITPPQTVFTAESIRNGVSRPTDQPNAWVADPLDPRPTLTLRWDKPRTLNRIVFGFDTDFDHPMESVLRSHPESVMPFCVASYRIKDADGRVIVECKHNHKTRNTWNFDPPISTELLLLEIDHPGADVPASLFEIRCYEPVKIKNHDRYSDVNS
jgi:hypothetical protein